MTAETGASVDLAAFLLARIEDEEQAADGIHDMHVDEYKTLEFFGDCSCGWPARVLAECASKRRIIEMHTMYWEPEYARISASPYVEVTGRTLWYCGLCDDDSQGNSPHLLPGCETLLALAQPFSAHPDFNADWAVA